MCRSEKIQFSHRMYSTFVRPKDRKHWPDHRVLQRSHDSPSLILLNSTDFQFRYPSSTENSNQSPPPLLEVKILDKPLGRTHDSSSKNETSAKIYYHNDALLPRCWCTGLHNENGRSRRDPTPTSTSRRIRTRCENQPDVAHVFVPGLHGKKRERR